MWSPVLLINPGQSYGRISSQNHGDSAAASYSHPGFDFERFAAENDGKNYDEWPCVLAEWYFKDPKPQLEESKMSPLAKVWKEVVGSPIIRFDLEERRKMKAYEILKPYIEAHEKMKRKS